MRRLTPILSMLLVAGACAGGQEVTEPSPATLAATTTIEPSTTSVTEVATEAATTTATTPGPVIITAFDYGYEGLPAVMQAGTWLRLRNDSSAEFHEMAILRLDPDDNRSLEEIKSLEPSELINNTGTFVAVAFSMPGEEQYRTVGGNTFIAQPGRYIIFCAIPVGSDPVEIRDQVQLGPPQQVEGAPAHYQVGMIAEFVVEE